MTKKKSILITVIFSLLFGTVLFAVALNSELIRLIILAVFAAPGYAAFVYGFYKWLKAAPEAEPKPTAQVAAYNYADEENIEKEVGRRKSMKKEPQGRIPETLTPPKL